MSDVESDLLFLNIYFRTEAMLRQAARRTLETNPLLQPLITASELKRRTSEKVVLRANQVLKFCELDVYLLVIGELKRSIVELYMECQLLEETHVEMTQSLDHNRMNDDNGQSRSDGAPRSVEEWIGFHHSFETLPPEQKSIMELGYYVGLNLMEIASLTNLPINMVSTLLVDGQKRLQNLILEKRRAI